MGALMRIVPVSLKAANAFVAEHHRHNRPVTGHKFSIGLEHDGRLVGVAIVGRPIARMLDNGRNIEILRVATDGTPNACSKLYSRASRISQLMGYERVLTYTLDTESGASMRAIGAELDGVVPPSDGWHSRPNRAALVTETVSKRRWLLNPEREG